MVVRKLERELNSMEIGRSQNIQASEFIHPAYKVLLASYWRNLKSGLKRKSLFFFILEPVGAKIVAQIVLQRPVLLQRAQLTPNLTYDQLMDNGRVILLGKIIQEFLCDIAVKLASGENVDF